VIFRGFWVVLGVVLINFGFFLLVVLCVCVCFYWSGVVGGMMGKPATATPQNSHHPNRLALLYPTVPLPPGHCHSPPRHWFQPTPLLKKIEKKSQFFQLRL
jgi:hypothetical protein